MSFCTKHMRPDLFTMLSVNAVALAVVSSTPHCKRFLLPALSSRPWLRSGVLCPHKGDALCCNLQRRKGLSVSQASLGTGLVHTRTWWLSRTVSAMPILKVHLCIATCSTTLFTGTSNRTPITSYGSYCKASFNRTAVRPRWPGPCVAESSIFCSARTDNAWAR